MIVKLLFLLSFINGVTSLTQSQIQAILDGHNVLRSNENAEDMIEFKWDTDLAVVAQNFADLGAFSGHNSAKTTQYQNLGGGNGYTGYFCVGENWYSGFHEDAAYKWVDFEWPLSWGGSGCSERQDYYGLQNSNGDTCSSSHPGSQTGHYTQVVWAETRYVGCGYTELHGTTCNYFPCGNLRYNGVLPEPFSSGTACADCPTDNPNCANELCTAGPPTTAAPTTNAPTSPPTAPTIAPPCTSSDKNSVGCGVCTSSNTDSPACRGHTFDVNGISDGGLFCGGSQEIYSCNGYCMNAVYQSIILPSFGNGNCNDYKNQGVDFNCPRFGCDGGDCTVCDGGLAFVGKLPDGGNITLLGSRGNAVYTTYDSSAYQCNAVVPYLSCAIFIFISYFA